MTERQPLPRGTETVLLVDDDEQVRRALGLLLESLGYDTHLAENAASALEILDDTGDKIDLLISDVVMPGMDGTELAGKVRECLPALPILLISGYSDTPVTGIPNTRFLRKPFSMSELAAEVRQTLKEFASAR